MVKPLKSIAVARANLQQADSEYLHAVVSLIEALICKEVGQPERGRMLAESARARVEQVFGRRSRVGGPLALAYADLLYEQDRHAAILTELPLATTWRDVATPVELISRGKLVMAKARFFAGEGESALAELDEWLADLHGPGYERVYALGMSCKVQFLLWLRKPNEAERTCLQLQRHLAVLPAGRYADAETAQALCEARLALTERRADKAQALLEASLAKQTAEHQRDRFLRLALLLSVAYWRKGNSDKAFILLRQTLEDAWGCGYRRIFLDDALWLLPLWDAWYAAEPKRAGHGRAWLNNYVSSAVDCPLILIISMKIKMLVIENERFYGLLLRVCPTATSLRRCIFPRPPSNGTCITCSPSWVCAAALRRY